MIVITGKSKIIYKGKFLSLTELTKDEHKEFEISAKRAIAKSLGKRIIRVVEK